MRLQVVFGVVGHLIRLFSLAFLPAFLLAVRDGLFDANWNLLETVRLDEAGRFLLTMVGTYVLGTLMARKPDSELLFRRAEALAVHELIDPRETRPLLARWIDRVQPLLPPLLGPASFAIRP